MANLKLLKNRNFALLISANGINRLGDALDAVALTWLIYDVSNSAALSAINFAINYVPTVLLQPIIGAYVTNKSKRKMMVMADFSRGIVVGLLAGLTMLSMVQPWMILVATFLLSVFETFQLPSANAIVPLVIDKDEYEQGVSLSSSSSRMFELIGSGLAGGIIALFGTWMAVLMDCISFFTSAILLSLMKVDEPLTMVKTNGFTTVKNNLKEGLSYVMQHHGLILLCGLTMIANMMLVPFNALLSAFIDQRFHGDAIYLSLISTTLTIGSLIGASLYVKATQLLSGRIRISMIFPICAFYYLSHLMIPSVDGVAYQMILLALVNLLAGIVVGVGNCEIAVFSMKQCERNYLSRVSALMNALGTAMIPVVSMVVSGLTTLISVSMIFVVSGIVMVLVSFIICMNGRMDVFNG